MAKKTPNTTTRQNPTKYPAIYQKLYRYLHIYNHSYTFAHMGRKLKGNYPQGVHGVHPHLRSIYARHQAQQKVKPASWWARITTVIRSIWPSK